MIVRQDWKDRREWKKIPRFVSISPFSRTTFNLQNETIAKSIAVVLATSTHRTASFTNIQTEASELLFVRTASFIARPVLLTVQVKYISVLSKHLRGKVRKLRELESFYTSPSSSLALFLSNDNKWARYIDRSAARISFWELTRFVTNVLLSLI